MRPVESRCGPAQRSVNSPCAIERDVRVLGQVVDQLDLIRLVLFLHILDGLVARQLKALELQLFLADLAHLGLDGVKIFLREVERRVEVVVEAVVDGRADGQLDLRATDA